MSHVWAGVELRGLEGAGRKETKNTWIVSKTVEKLSLRFSYGTGSAGKAGARMPGVNAGKNLFGFLPASVLRPPPPLNFF